MIWGQERVFLYEAPELMVHFQHPARRARIRPRVDPHRSRALRGLQSMDPAPHAQKGAPVDAVRILQACFGMASFGCVQIRPQSAIGHDRV